MSDILYKLEDILIGAWDQETSSEKNWNYLENRQLGQCAVTACVIQDYIGGEIVWAKAILPNKKTRSHYFNKVNNTEYDFTRLQFPIGTKIKRGKKRNNQNTREYILSYPETEKRYKILKERVERILAPNKKI